MRIAFAIGERVVLPVARHPFLRHDRRAQPEPEAHRQRREKCRRTPRCVCARCRKIVTQTFVRWPATIGEHDRPPPGSGPAAEMCHASKLSGAGPPGHRRTPDRTQCTGIFRPRMNARTQSRRRRIVARTGDSAIRGLDPSNTDSATCCGGPSSARERGSSDFAPRRAAAAVHRRTGPGARASRRVPHHVDRPLDLSRAGRRPQRAHRSRVRRSRLAACASQDRAASAPPGLALDALPPIDLVLQSHDHYDHFDAGPFARSRTAPPPPSGARRSDWPRVSAHSACGTSRSATGSTTAEPVPGARVACVSARHFSGRSLTDRNATLWCGWTLTAGGTSRVFRRRLRASIRTSRRSAHAKARSTRCSCRSAPTIRAGS